MAASRIAMRASVAARSSRSRVKHDDIGTAGCEVWHVSHSRLTLGAAESGLNGGKIVEVEQRDERRPGRCGNWSLADLVLAQARYLLGDLNVLLGKYLSNAAVSLGVLYITTS